MSSFDLTYEGLKLSFKLKERSETPCFDLTYEGLKSKSNQHNTCLYIRFDLTYEGLKYLNEIENFAKGAVLILPMRD